MQNYTCFWHPELGYGERAIDDPCDQCGRPMDHPLNEPPDQVGEYRIVATLDRGYYAATYVAEQAGVITRRVCLKIAPAELYERLAKDFEAECRAHQQVAEGTAHLVEIQGAFRVPVNFGADPDAVDCQVAVLDYVPGVSLRSILEGETQISTPLQWRR